MYKWTGETIKKALRLKHACGDNGYKELLREYFPLPATRTLRNRLECISFKDGICDEVFDLLKEKVSNFPDERHSDCMICVDEMSLTPGEQIDPCTNHTIGYATIPDKFGKSFP
ncbi:PREDICTED: uncharacterized protein LOC105556388 [Vollenhovia emeryi]|uniref:uncharacterized protein LOC105556388 n=1 Tax=Vollenhovia emeryi TaxID=411798 RepID=UPI0005F50C4B|nr:PREDICTED: uncharacterized protein LOC105556388 [Vollenhovia emeryi]